jgi:hypothetical protein
MNRFQLQKAGLSPAVNRKYWATTLALAAGLLAAPAWAVTRQGGSTDDSVCDVGRTYERSRDSASSWEFVRTQCKNGQLLMGTSVVPVGGGETEIMGLAKTFCRIADIQSRRFQGSVGPLGMELEEARCRVEKLPK